MTRAGRDHVVCAIEDLPPGSMRLVPVGKFGIGVYNVHGDLYAITNYCPHEGAPLCLGRVQGTTVSHPASRSGVAYVMEGRVVRCPWHQWEFDLATGRTIASPHKGIRTYPVRVEEQQVIVTT